MKELPDDSIESINNLLEKGKVLSEHYKEFLIMQLGRLIIFLLFNTKPIPAGSEALRLEGTE